MNIYKSKEDIQRLIDILVQAKEFPDMYFGYGYNISHLEMFVAGYSAALKLNFMLDLSYIYGATGLHRFKTFEEALDRLIVYLKGLLNK